MQSKNNIDVVVSTRVRLARNLKDFPFSGHMSTSQMKEIDEKIKNAFMGANSNITANYEYADMEKLSDFEAAALVEQHLISPGFATDRKNRGLIVSKDKETSIMINEEDHLRIQTIKRGLDLEKAFSEANRIDDLFDELLNYAFDERLGFLTCCPTNLGTGMRASVMLHLPALAATNSISKILGAVTKFGLTVRGIYGEGSEAQGDLYQVSNQVTLGVSERETIDRLKDIVMQIITQEKNARELMHKNNEIVLEDKIYRSYGTLNSARLLSSSEFLKHYSLLRLGASIGLIKGITPQQLDTLFENAGAANITVKQGKELTGSQRDYIRANLVRESLNK